MKTLTTLFAALFASISLNATTVEITGTTLAASSTENTVTLNFTAANVNGSARYEIERSFYSNDFTTVVTMQIPFATAAVNNYRVNDNAAELTGRAIAYYRVKQIAANGAVTYSNTMVVELNNNAMGIANSKTVRFAAAQNGTAVICIKNITGQVVATVNSNIVKGNNSVELNNNMAKGMYVAEIAVNGVVTATQKIIAE
ncbi:MAG TPA: T9SS type A sorting domain-containing protein [Ferruginibacter sp.]|nr:T9SS type A sorting domain-containing protein [Ferruginibacter sp.]HMP19866.1 T9SS type A sorting domain-containing protein [Ferruginibacter sp.]